MARLKNMTRWIALLAAITIGHVAGMAALCLGAGSSPRVTLADVLLSPLLMLTGVVSAAIGPFGLVCFGLYTFRVRGGTPIAVGSLMLMVPVLYLLLTVWMRSWAKMERPAAKWASYIAMVCYSALSTYCIAYVSSHM